MSTHPSPRGRRAACAAVPFRMYVLITVVVLSVMVAIGYGSYVTHQMVARHVPLIDAAMEIRLALARVHEGYHRLLRIDTTMRPEQIIGHLGEARWYGRAILAGGRRGAEELFAVGDTSMRRRTMELMGYLDRLEEMVGEHTAADGTDGAVFDEHEDLLRHASGAARRLELQAKELVRSRYRLLRILQRILMVVTGGIGVVAMLVLHGYGRRRERDLDGTRRLNRDLDAANQQLQANEQQLRAANQQLRANEQQLRAANEHIRASESKYRGFVEHLPGIAFRCDLDFTPHFFHGKVEQITGYTEREFLDGISRWNELVYADDRACIRGTDRDLLDGPGVSLEREYRIVRRDGELRWVREAIQNLCDDEGRLQLVQGLIIDITRRRQAELALAAEQNRAREYLRVANVMMLALDREGRVMMINRKGAEIIGRSEEDIIGEDWFATYLSEESRVEIGKVFQRLMRGDTEVDEYHENTIVSASGETRLMAWHNTLLRDEAGNAVGTLSSGEDISERRKAQEALAASERRFKSLVQNASDVTMVWRADGTIAYASPSSERLLGREPVELIDRSVFELLAAGDVEAVRRTLSRLLSLPGRPVAMECRCHHVNGTLLTFEALASNLLNDPDIGGIVVNARDITERVAMERQLQDRAAFEELTAAISGRFVHLEAEEIAGAIEDALARVGEFMGVDRSYVFLYDTTGRTATNTHEWCAEGIPPQKADLQDVSKEEMGWSLGGLYEGRSLIVNELGDVPVEAGADRAVFQEGKIQSLLCVPMKVRGRVMGFVGCDCVRAERSWSADEIRMLRVIAEVMANGLERERAEEALRREHHLATRLADTSPVGVVQIDGHGRITVANKRAEDLLELSRDERGAYCAPLWRVTTVDGADPPPQELPHIMIQLSRQPVHGLRQGIVWPDGRRMVVSVSGAPLIGPDGRFEGGVFSIEDITERLRIEEELQKSQRLESLGMLAGGIAHDFNNLLGGLFGYLDMAREECRAASPAAGELLDKALTGYQRARDLTQQLLTFAKGGAPVRRLASIAATVHEAASLALSGSTIVPSFTIADDVWDGEIDEGQISQVVNNLVINARHAMPRGGRLEVRCRNREIDDRTALAVAPGKYVEVTITDSGMGIPREHMGRIFDPFFTTKQQGSGLGLASAYSIVKKHGGDISVNSKLGRGTTFCVFLPAVAERTAKQSPKTVDERVRHGAGRVLLMDDEAVIVEMATELLKRLGYEVHNARHGEEALDAYRHARESGSPFDVVILDLTIAGGMGGLETIRKLREIDGDVRAIVSSGYAEDPAMADPEAYGFQGVVRKPYRIRDLSGVLARLLR